MKVIQAALFGALLLICAPCVTLLTIDTAFSAEGNAAQATSQIQNAGGANDADKIRRQLEKCWDVPMGNSDESKIIVPIRLSINPLGVVTNAQIIDDKGYYASNMVWQAVADSAMRASGNPFCSALQLPSDRYDYWKNITVIFSVSDILPSIQGTSP